MNKWLSSEELLEKGSNDGTSRGWCWLKTSYHSSSRIARNPVEFKLEGVVYLDWYHRWVKCTPDVHAFMIIEKPLE